LAVFTPWLALPKRPILCFFIAVSSFRFLIRCPSAQSAYFFVLPSNFPTGPWLLAPSVAGHSPSPPADTDLQSGLPQSGSRFVSLPGFHGFLLPELLPLSGSTYIKQELAGLLFFSSRLARV